MVMLYHILFIGMIMGIKYVRGEAFRNSPSPAELMLKLFVNDKLVQEDSKAGTSSSYARVTFDYTIK